MTGKIVIFGAGALARETLQIIRDCQTCGSEIECCGFLVDPWIEAPAQVKGLPVLRYLGPKLRDSALSFVIAVGEGRARVRIAQELALSVGPRFATLVHPSSWIGGDVTIGAGCILFGNISATADVKLAQHIIVNPGTTLAHDVEVESFATLSPGVDLAGRVRLGEGCTIGTGASIIPGVAIGAWATVGAGAVVLKDVPSGVTVVGVPARALRTGVKRDQC